MNDKETAGKIRKHLLHAFVRTASFVLSFVLIFKFVFGITVTESNDMYPAVRAGDVVLYYRLAEPDLQDVVIYEGPSGENIGRVQACCSSVVGLSGDGAITIDGRIQPVQKRSGLFYRTFEREGKVRYPILLGTDEYFILGDKRDTAEDSRSSGAVKRENIAGKVFMTLRRRTI